MISFLGLITFLLRLTLAIQGQIVGVLPLGFSEEKSCLTSESHDSRIYSIVNLDPGKFNWLCESEKEEKSESETEGLAELLRALNEISFARGSKNYYNPFFGNKALHGEQHLYDLFHSWKVHLS